MKIPRPIQDLIEALERLPGIGPKTAARLTFYLLHVPQEELDKFAKALLNLRKKTVLCLTCFNVAESNPCPICSDETRDKAKICVVEQPLDVLAIEKSNSYKGLYHVLHGAIDPLNNIGPDELKIKELIKRLQSLIINHQSLVIEVILATNPNMEGEATAMYVARRLREQLQSTVNSQQLKITRIGRGLPVGGDLEYADEVTLTRALEGRREY
jgi:recombination protein RecR